MIRKTFIAIAVLSLSACATTYQSETTGIHSLGGDLFSISQRAVPFGGTAPRAAAFCAKFGQQMRVEGNSTEQSLWTDRQYAVLMFRCVS